MSPAVESWKPLAAPPPGPCPLLPESAGVLARLSHVSLRFGPHPVIEDVSLSIREGEIVSLLGPNGAGKSTLLRILLGLVQPDSGTVQLRPGLRIGYVPQRIAIDPTLPLDVRSFLALARDRRSPRRRFDPVAALAETGAAPLIERPLQSLSGGELQRVLLARSLLREPELLVLDEPAQGVDMTGQAECFALIRRIRDFHRCGVLLVSHDLPLVMASADRVICLDRRILCCGRPETVWRHPAYHALFGAAATALAAYAHPDPEEPEEEEAGEKENRVQEKAAISCDACGASEASRQDG
jgi:zinc transport system ATP-binding protein